MRKYLRSLLALSVLLTSASALQAAAAPAAELVAQGKVVGRIVLPAKATDGEALAAQQVQSFVKQMSGAELPIVKAGEGGAGPAIVIGNQPANQAVIDQLNKEHPDTIDAFAVVGNADQLSLVGRSDDSTMWAAWQWLNDEGVVFLMPGEHGTYVPHKTSIEIASVNEIEAPRVAARGSYSIMSNKDRNPEGLYTLEQGLPAWKMFMFRMRMNYNTSFNDRDRMFIMGSGNSYSGFLPPAKYYKDHPEWYSTSNGKAPTGNVGWQICFTSQEAAAEYAKNMLGALKRQLDQGFPLDQMELLVTPNDGLAIISTPEGKKLIDKDGSYSSLVTNFANMVAEHIHKVYPKARITFLAYSNYATAPDYVKPGPNVCQVITAWPAANSLAVNMAHPLFSEANHKYQNAFEEWSKSSGGLGAYTYYGHYNWFTPWPMTTQMAHDIPTMCADPKFFHMYSENHPSWGTQGLTMWLYPRLLWNPKLDVQAAVAAYDKAAFGPAAEAMQNYQKALQDSMDRQGRIGGNVWEIPFVLTPAVIEQCNGFIAQAQKLEDQMDPDTRWRTELACQAWQASAKFGEAVRLFTRGKTAADREKILSLCAEVDQFAQTDLGKWAFDNTVATRSIKVITDKFKVDLNNLPPGKQTFNDDFNYGGAIKFFGKVRGFQPGMWGYILPVNTSGQIDLELKAATGHKITSARVQWNIPHADQVGGTLSIVSGDKSERVLTSDVTQMVKGVDLPADALDGTIQLKLHMVNQHYDPTIVLTGCRIEMQVE
jgi:hypothetical protein